MFKKTTSTIVAKNIFLAFLITGFFINPISSEAKKGDLVLRCEFIYSIQRILTEQHVKMSISDADLQNRVIDQYIKRLDPTKIYLTQPDVEMIKDILKGENKSEKKDEKVADGKKAKKGILENIRDQNNCNAIFEAHKILVKQVQKRAEFAKSFMAKDYKFDSTVEFIYDPDKKPFPANEEEAEAFLKKYVHFQISNYLVADLKIEEAKTNVNKSWDRVSKRILDSKEDEVLGGYLDSYARALDPHTAYLLPDNNEDFKITMSLKLQGIGATLKTEDGFTIIEALVPGGPAAKSGLLMPQDKIIAVGQGEDGNLEDVIEMELREVVKRIRGTKNTKVRLMILRKETSGSKSIPVTLVRDEINLEDDAASIIYQEREVMGKKRKFGLINFPGFYADSRKDGRSSAKDLKNLLIEAKKNKVDGIMLDLSLNGGGSLDDAVKVAGLFFASGAVVKQSGRDGVGKSEIPLKDSDPNVEWAGPLVVLTSRFSASASEIVAGTLKDYKRAVVVGSPNTFGKGTIQTVLDIPPESGTLGAVKVTVGMFFTPGGNSTQHRGVEADVIFPSQYDSEESGEKSLDYSLPPAQIEPFLSQEAYVKEGPNAWSQINSDIIRELGNRSKSRVEKSAEFKKIVEDLNKAKTNGKLIKLSEVMKKDKDKDKEKKDKKSKRSMAKKDREKEYLKRADILEAVSILGDLYELQNGKQLKSASK